MHFRHLLPILVAYCSYTTTTAVSAQDGQQGSMPPAITQVPIKPTQLEPTLVQLLEQARQCSGSQCRFQLGADFQITLTGMGKPNAGIVYERSNVEGRYYASFGLAHGCVIVQAGRAQANAQRPHDFAFIQPRTGKVFEKWQECKAE